MCAFRDIRYGFRDLSAKIEVMGRLAAHITWVDGCVVCAMEVLLNTLCISR